MLVKMLKIQHLFAFIELRKVLAASVVILRFLMPGNILYAFYYFKLITNFLILLKIMMKTIGTKKVLHLS